MQFHAFSNVDATSDPQTFVQYLAMVSEHPLVRERSRRRAELLGDVAGSRVLDIGCGIGADCRMLGQAVGSGGTVTGLDKSALMVDAATERTPDDHVSFRAGDAEALPFDNDSFDVCWMERTLVHVPDPAKAIAECARVLAPGGRIVLAEMDYVGIMVDDEAGDPSVLDTVVGATVGGARNPRIGRSLLRLVREGGFTPRHVVDDIIRLDQFMLADAVVGFSRVTTALVESGRVTEAALTELGGRLDRTSRDGLFTCLIPSVTIIAELNGG